MPPHLASILDELGPPLCALMADALSRVTEAGVAAGGDAHAVENDALSLQSQLVAIAASLFLASLAEAKGVPIALAQEAGMIDVIAPDGRARRRNRSARRPSRRSDAAVKRAVNAPPALCERPEAWFGFRQPAECRCNRCGYPARRLPHDPPQLALPLPWPDELILEPIAATRAA